MGESIKDVGSFSLGKEEFHIELNFGTKQEKYNIHIQNSNLKLCFKDYDFVKFAEACLIAEKRLEFYKGNENE